MLYGVLDLSTNVMIEFYAAPKNAIKKVKRMKLKTNHSYMILATTNFADNL